MKTLAQAPAGQEASRAAQGVWVGARAVIAAAIRVFVIQAALDFNTRKARGLDGALESFAHTPAGPRLLVLVPAGPGAFGLYSLAEAMWADL
jgi:hypothetical protein